MKKCILSVIADALAMLVVVTVVATIHANKEQIPEKYEYIDYVSNIPSEECYVCGSASDFLGSFYWGEDNVGIVNLNTFDPIRLKINRYDDHRNLIGEPAGFMSSGGLSNKETETYVHVYCHPDNAYADVQLFGVQYAVVSFEDRTTRPLLNAHPWLSAGNYGIDCEFKDDGKIDLLVHYIASRNS